MCLLQVWHALVVFAPLLPNFLSLPAPKHLLHSSLLSTYLKYQLIALHSSLVWQLFFPFFVHFSTFFVGVSPFLCPDTNFHTPIPGNVRNVSVPAASCCCCTYGRNRGAWGARVFLQGPRMDGWIDTGIEWLMKKRGRVDPPLNGSIPAPRVNNDVLILLRKSVFSMFPNTTQMLKGKKNLSGFIFAHKLLGFARSWTHFNDNIHSQIKEMCQSKWYIQGP